MANWLRLRRQSHAPREQDGTETIYAAADGTLMHMDPDGAETELGSGESPGGSQPFDVLSLNDQVGLDWNQLTVALWLDASDGETISETAGKVSVWSDKSGNDRDAVQATAEAKPTTGSETIGGLNALSFDGAATYLTADLDDAGSFFQAAVVKPGALDLDSFNYCVLSSDSDNRLQFNNAADAPEVQGIAAALSLTADVVQDARVIVRAGSVSASENAPLTTIAAELIRTGELVARGSSNPTVGSPLFIGATTGPDAFFLGAIGEVVHVSGLLTPEQQQNVIDYLADKWGIT